MPVPRRLGIRIKEIAGGSKATILKKREDELKKKNQSSLQSMVPPLEEGLNGYIQLLGEVFFLRDFNAPTPLPPPLPPLHTLPQIITLVLSVKALLS